MPKPYIKFGNLNNGEFIYYINPKIKKLERLVVKGVEDFYSEKPLTEPFVRIEYYVSEQVVEAAKTIKADDAPIPTRVLIFPKGASSVLTKSLPLNMYFTTVEELKEWLKR